MTHDRLHMFCARHFGKLMLPWLLTFLALVVAKLTGFAANPWAAVLFPLWGPPAFFVVYRLTKKLLRVVGWIIVAVLE